MTKMLAGSLAVLAGVLVATQAAILGAFERHIHPFTGAMWVHVGGLVFAAVVVAATGLGFGWAGVRAYPAGLLAGVCGVGIVAAIGAVVTPLGLGTTIVIVTAAQLLLGLALDAVGITGRVVPLTAPRVLGVVLVAAGALLVFGRTPPAG